ncbi:MAG: hypothetical protein L6Q37_07275 [Bdellovibrionaceae bacterium]|nr:hypothetical protein [Pseudobdellovibrionaceae bacterium]NUM59125.1 hypothetical protein [Pseudobdellovibrionaceae bacterium]
MGTLLKKILFILVLLTLSKLGYAFGSARIAISPQVLISNRIPFIPHTGQSAFDNVLAMNIPYQPVAEVRHQLSDLLRYNLNFFKGWNPQGEAHITVITPPEYAIVGRYISIQKINEIALRNNIQHSDLQILGLGSGYLKINSSIHSTYFLIVKSKNLISIRQQIYLNYLKNGGSPDGWNPQHFYPHITIGFTLRDLHEQDGIIKDFAHSLDKRFQMFWLYR